MLYDQASAQKIEKPIDKAKIRILIVDDDLAILRFLRPALNARDYDVYEATTGEDAILKAVNVRPDLIILDLNLPGLSGIEVTKRLREWTQAPIIIISVQAHDTDKIEALDAGANDYLTKPFSIGELAARLRVVLRYLDNQEPELVFKQGALRVDLTARLVTCEGKAVQLTPTEYDLLRILIKYSGRVLTHQQLLKEIRGSNHQAETHLLHVHMSNLRRKIEANPSRPRYILTEPGVGYRLKIEL